MKRTFILSHDQARQRAKAHIDEAPDGSVVTVGPSRRSGDQNAMFHALCTLLERSRLEWAKKPRTAAEWKVLLVSGHAVVTKDGAEIVPGLEGEFVNIRESTAAMSKARGSSLIDYTLAFCAAHGIDTLEAVEVTA